MVTDHVSAVLVTRGDVDLDPVLESLPFDDIVVYDNSATIDLQVYGRYRAIQQAKHPFIYTQDDDAICPAADLCAVYDGDGLLVNVCDGEKPWLAWGALFPRSLPFVSFVEYIAAYGDDKTEIRRWPDVIFAHTAGWRQIDLGHHDLPHAFADNRMYRQPDHYTSQDKVRARAEALR